MAPAGLSAMRRRSWATAWCRPALVALAAAGGAAGAAAEAGREPLWELGFGAASLRLPHYRGSAETRQWLLPVPYLVYRGDFFKSDRDGTRALLVEHDRVDIDFSVGASPPARDEPGGARTGMPELPPTVELGPRLNVLLLRTPRWRVGLHLPLRTVLTLERSPRNVGWVLEPTLSIDADRGPTQYGLRLSAIQADARQHRHLYGVSAEQATGTRPAYDARGGDAGWQLTLGASRRIGRLWLGAYLRHDVLAGSVVADSPLVTARRSTTGGVALSWVFAVSRATVPATPL